MTLHDENAEESRQEMSSPHGDGNLQNDVSELQVPEGFSVRDCGSANWLVRKVLDARAYRDRVAEWAEAEKHRAEREEQALMFLFGRQIEIWAKEEIENLRGRRKSINLPAGVVGFRKINSSLQVDNELRVLCWAKEHCPTAVNLVEKLCRSELKNHFENTGEVPDGGAHVEPPGEKFYIR